MRRFIVRVFSLTKNTGVAAMLFQTMMPRSLVSYHDDHSHGQVSKPTVNVSVPKVHIISHSTGGVQDLLE